jgi:hypothetical protein
MISVAVVIGAVAASVHARSDQPGCLNDLAPGRVELLYLRMAALQ